MNNFHPDLHGVVAKRFEERGVKTVLGKRVKIPPSGAFPAFEKGKTFDVELQNSDERKLKRICAHVYRSIPPLFASRFLLPLPPSRAMGSSMFTQPCRSALPPPPHRTRKQDLRLGDIANSGAAKAARAAMPQIDVIKSNILSSHR